MSASYFVIQCRKKKCPFNQAFPFFVPKGVLVFFIKNKWRSIRYAYNCSWGNTTKFAKKGVNVERNEHGEVYRRSWILHRMLLSTQSWQDSARLPNVLVQRNTFQLPSNNTACSQIWKTQIAKQKNSNRKTENLKIENLKTHYAQQRNLKTQNTLRPTKKLQIWTFENTLRPTKKSQIWKTQNTLRPTKKPEFLMDECVANPVAESIGACVGITQKKLKIANSKLFHERNSPLSS